MTDRERYTLIDNAYQILAFNANAANNERHDGCLNGAYLHSGRVDAIQQLLNSIGISCNYTISSDYITEFEIDGHRTRTTYAVVHGIE